jgi:hypothetical protein
LQTSSPEVVIKHNMSLIKLHNICAVVIDNPEREYDHDAVCESHLRISVYHTNTVASDHPRKQARVSISSNIWRHATKNNQNNKEPKYSAKRVHCRAISVADCCFIGCSALNEFVPFDKTATCAYWCGHSSDGSEMRFLKRTVNNYIVNKYNKEYIR